jgi:hypothetical protein
MEWYEGVDIDVDSGLSHITKAIATLMVLRDGMLADNWVDDRPPVLPAMRAGYLAKLNADAKKIIEKYPESKAPHTNVSAST